MTKKITTATTNTVMNALRRVDEEESCGARRRLEANVVNSEGSDIDLEMH
jgi:hypothetical protein